MVREVPPTFRIQFSKLANCHYQLKTSQVLPITQTEAFKFFEDPESLPKITPDWLDFRMVNTHSVKEISEGVIFNLTIRWIGFKITWQSKIIDYKPPERFIDIQLKGPYKYWRHLHTFENAPDGTLLKDEVTFTLPLGLIGCLLHRAIIKRQLEDIFSYRAIRISEWARGEFKGKTS